MASREAHRIERAISQARFPVLKDLADFDWNAVPSVRHLPVFWSWLKGRILPKLSQSSYWETLA